MIMEKNVMDTIKYPFSISFFFEQLIRLMFNPKE